MANVLLIIGIICIVNAGAFLGAWTSGQRQRSNYHTETTEDRLMRLKVGRVSLLIGVLILFAALIVYVLF